MKTKRIATVLAVLLCMAGCTVANAVQEEQTSPTFSSAGISEAASSHDEESPPDKQEETIANKQKENLSEGKENKQETAEPVKTVVPAAVQKSPPQDVPMPEKQQPSPTVPETEQPKEEPVKQSDPKPAEEKIKEPEPEVILQEPDPEPEPKPEPKKACPGGKNPDLGCEIILDQNYYRETFSSYAEAAAKGEYYMDEVMYIGDIEITSYSVQEVYRNDHSIAYYGLNLWSNGSLIQ